MLGEYAGRRDQPNVSDPFGGDLTSYRTTFAELQDLIGRVASRVAGRIA